MSTIRTLTTSAAVLLACAFVGACAIERAQEAADAKTNMVGMLKESVLACMGAPVTSATVGATEVWSYASGNGQTDTVALANASGFRSSKYVTPHSNVAVVSEPATISVVAVKCNVSISMFYTQAQVSIHL